VLDRIQQGGTATISVALTVGGTAQDPTPDSATVTITRADGTAVVTDAGAQDSGTGVFSYPLNPDETALLDTLTATWTFTADGSEQSRQTFHEVVGGFLFTLPELTAELGSSTETYTTSQKAEARTYAEAQLEHACGQAFVPRYERETLSGTGTGTLRLKWPHVRSVRSVLIDDTAGVAADVAFRPYGHAYYAAGWTLGYGNVIVGYEHGLPHPPPGATEAALVLAKHKLVKGPIDERATQRTSEFGPVNLATPGLFGDRFGLPVVNAFVAAHDMRVGVA
jgi:hypothetical protein